MMKKIAVTIFFILIFNNISHSQTVLSSEDIYKINGAQVKNIKVI